MKKVVAGNAGWFYLAVCSLVVSLGSLFLPIIRCTNYSFNIIDLLSGNSDFEHYVVDAYSGPIIFRINTGMTIVLAAIGVAALLCAVIGLLTLRAQNPNTRNFILTLVGLIGILIPSVIVIICVLFFGQYYKYDLSLGIAPILSPIAILVSIGAVIRRKNKVAEEYKKMVEEKGLIWKAGDL